jgi:AcrR family transcriptional regulator
MREASARAKPRPYHHGDLRTAVLAAAEKILEKQGVDALTGAMDAAGADPLLRMRAMGRAYVGFARAHPNLFLLMFRSDRLDMTRPALREAIESTRQALRNATLLIASAAPLPSPLQLAARATASWALVHGFAMLLLDGRLRNTLASLPGGGNVDALLEAVLDVTRVND